MMTAEDRFARIVVIVTLAASTAISLALLGML